MLTAYFLLLILTVFLITVSHLYYAFLVNIEQVKTGVINLYTSDKAFNVQLFINHDCQYVYV